MESVDQVVGGQYYYFVVEDEKYDINRCLHNLP